MEKLTEFQDWLISKGYKGGRKNDEVKLLGFFGGWGWGVELRAIRELLHQPFCLCVMGFFNIGLVELSAWTGFKLKSS
jgi:hypothetical protein